MRTASGCRQQRGSIGVGTWVDRRRGVGRAGEPWSSTASVGFCFAILWVERRQDVGVDIGWRQHRGSIGLGLWWLETSWVSRSESRTVLTY